MKLENELAMIVAFYLSKFGDVGLAKLGYGTYRQAFDEISLRLRVNRNSVKNWRDEFDPYYDNGRKGWYQRGIRPSRQKVMTAFDDLSESALRAVVFDILRPESRTKVKADLRPMLKEIKMDENKGTRKSMAFMPRGPTGRLAEEFFLSRFRAGLTPFTGKLHDRRDEGTGFDFEISARRSRILIEIKGLAREPGGITFTDKEWRVANEMQANYYLGLVTQVVTSPRLGFVQNPAIRLNPVYRAYTTVAVNWSVSAEQVSRIDVM